ncbi:MAG TPA: hypothetical protein DIC35_02180 [Candidatus Moranbacteria bacterium]|nr:hypothetical protein [Candidatus Moranbacteria bacterium]
MEIPKDWKDCTRISLRIFVPPHLIAEAHNIEPGSIEIERHRVSDASDKLVCDYLAACERNDVDAARAILRECFEKHAHTKGEAEYIFQQAMYLMDKGLALEALQKMIALTPD